MKEKRAAKDKDGAATIKALRKPTAAAWALNQLSRKNTKALDDFIDLAEKLRKAQRSALSGRGATSLRELSADRRKAVDSLTKKAMAHLGASGESQRDAIATSLEAALASEDASDELRDGRLTKPLDPPSGFGGDIPGLTLVPDLDDVPDQPGTDSESTEAASARERRRAARAERRTRQNDDADADKAKDAEAEQRRQELEELVTAKVAALDKAREEAQSAAREAAAARAEVSRLQDELVSANGRAKAAAEKARVAQWAQSQAQQELDAANRKLDAL